MNFQSAPALPACPTARPMRAWVALVLAGLLAAPVMAQGVYRIVGPDGRVTFSDQPPPADAAPARPVNVNPAGGSGNAALPFELRQVVSRYPVTLYTSSDCAPCNSGRNLLNSRGVPYVEKTVNTAQDTEALKRLSGDTSLPFMTIGGQQLKGYSDSEWTQFLDAAGYPKQSALPAGFRRAAVTPLVAIKPAEPAAPARSTAPATGSPASVPVAPPTENPAGIRF